MHSIVSSGSGWSSVSFCMIIPCPLHAWHVVFFVMFLCCVFVVYKPFDFRFYLLPAFFQKPCAYTLCVPGGITDLAQ